MIDSKLQNDVHNMSLQAVEYAKSFSVNLDYSEESLRDIENILEYYHNDIKRSNPTEKQISSMSLIWGSYIGEVMVKNGDNNCFWCFEEAFGTPKFLHLKVDDNNLVCPIDKAYKRLVNGSEDEIPFFYEVFKKRILNEDDV